MDPHFRQRISLFAPGRNSENKNRFAGPCSIDVEDQSIVFVVLVFPDSTFNPFDEANTRTIITSGTLLNFLVVKAGCWNLGKGWSRLVCIPESLSGYRISGLDWPRFGSPTRQHPSSGPKPCPSRLIHHSINWLGFPCSLSSARDQALYFMASISQGS